jgi:hypothetical protein
MIERGFLVRGNLRPTVMGPKGGAVRGIKNLPARRGPYPIVNHNRVPSSVALKRQPGMRG